VWATCVGAVFNLMGTTLASTDADGMVNLWDTRVSLFQRVEWGAATPLARAPT
jgi:hypothetical protein